MSQSLKDRATCVFFLLLGMCLAVSPSVLYERHRLQEEVVSKDGAYYHPKTRAFTVGKLHKVEKGSGIYIYDDEKSEQEALKTICENTPEKDRPDVCKKTH